MDEQTITNVKAAFIRSQVRYLSAPLEPSTQWRDLASEPAEGQLSDKSIEDIVSKGPSVCLELFTGELLFFRLNTNVWQSTRK